MSKKWWLVVAAAAAAIVVIVVKRQPRYDVEPAAFEPPVEARKAA
jgi:hypothetical protein